MLYFLCNFFPSLRPKRNKNKKNHSPNQDNIFNGEIEARKGPIEKSHDNQASSFGREEEFFRISPKNKAIIDRDAIKREAVKTKFLPFSNRHPIKKDNRTKNKGIQNTIGVLI